MRSIYRSCCLERKNLSEYFRSTFQKRIDSGQLLSLAASTKGEDESSKNVRFAESECISERNPRTDYDESPLSQNIHHDIYLPIEEADCPHNIMSAALAHLAVLNTIISVTGKYFGQEEVTCIDSESHQCKVVGEVEHGGDEYGAVARGDIDYRLDEDGLGDY